MIRLVADGSQTVARLFHPIFGEVAMQRAGVVCSRQLNGMLAQHLGSICGAGRAALEVADVRTQNRLASNPRCKFFANSTTASPGPVVVNNEIRARANLDGRPRELGCDRVVVAVLLAYRQGPHQRTRS